MIQSYDELVAAIGRWLNREDLAATIPDFIQLGEAQMMRRLRLRKMLKRATTDLTGPYIPLPCDWLEGKNVQINTDPPWVLEPASHYQLDRTQAALGNGLPQIYTVFGDTMEVRPAPVGQWQIEMIYYATIPALSSAAPSNWLFARAPDLYLYSALIASAPYLRDDQRIAVWGGALSDIYEELRIEDERSEYSGGTPRMRIRGAF